jgi:hypothetical protein
VAKQFLASLTGQFGELDFASMTDTNLNILLNIHRNEYLGNLSKTQVFHARALQAQKVSDSLAQLLKSREDSEMVEGVRQLSLEHRQTSGC